MMYKDYTSFTDTKKLKLLNLQRQIALEELKVSKCQLEDSLSTYHWFETVFNLVKKYGVLYLKKNNEAVILL